MAPKTSPAIYWLPLTGALLLAVAPACTAKKEKPAETAKKTAAAEKKPEKKAPEAKAPVADPMCLAQWNVEGEPTKIEAKDRTFMRTGTKLEESTSDDDEKAVLGVLANMKEDTPKNMENIDAALAFFEKSGAEAIVIVGDLGETQAQIENVLNPIAARGLPTFVIIGNREKRTDYREALTTVSKAHPNVVDLNQVRLAKLDDVALVSLPGYYDKRYIHAENGCQYFASDVKATEKIIAAAGDAPTVLVSHGPPKQEGEDAIDRTLEKANVGDPNLTKLIEETGVKMGLFANVHEAGGRATDLSGKTIVPPNTPSEVLFLNPGSIDSVSWQMNDGSRSVGMAAVMTVDEGKAAFEVFKIPDEG